MSICVGGVFKIVLFILCECVKKSIERQSSDMLEYLLNWPDMSIVIY